MIRGKRLLIPATLLALFAGPLCVERLTAAPSLPESLLAATHGENRVFDNQTATSCGATAVTMMGQVDPNSTYVSQCTAAGQNYTNCTNAISGKLGSLASASNGAGQANQNAGDCGTLSTATCQNAPGGGFTTTQPNPVNSPNTGKPYQCGQLQTIQNQNGNPQPAPPTPG